MSFSFSILFYRLYDMEWKMVIREESFILSPSIFLYIAFVYFLVLHRNSDSHISTPRGIVISSQWLWNQDETKKLSELVFLKPDRTGGFDQESALCPIQKYL